MFTPLGAISSGLSRVTKLLFTNVDVPPRDEKDATPGQTGVNGGMLSYNIAPTAIAPSALGWPTMVEVLLDG